MICHAAGKQAYFPASPERRHKSLDSMVSQGLYDNILSGRPMYSYFQTRPRESRLIAPPVPAARNKCFLSAYASPSGIPPKRIPARISAPLPHANKNRMSVPAAPWQEAASVAGKVILSLFQKKISIAVRRSSSP